MTTPTQISAERDRLIHILVVHFDMLRAKAEEAADLFLHDKILPAVAAPTEDWVLVPRDFIEFVKGAPVYSGVCCCGDSMDNHSDPMSCGHSPVDQWDYSLSKWIEQIKAVAGNPTPEDASVKFGKALSALPALAVAAGCHVGIKVTEAKS